MGRSGIKAFSWVLYALFLPFAGRSTAGSSSGARKRTRPRGREDAEALLLAAPLAAPRAGQPRPEDPEEPRGRPLRFRPTSRRRSPSRAARACRSSPGSAGRASCSPGPDSRDGRHGRGRRGEDQADRTAVGIVDLDARLRADVPAALVSLVMPSPLDSTVLPKSRYGKTGCRAPGRRHLDAEGPGRDAGVVRHRERHLVRREREAVGRRDPGVDDAALPAPFDQHAPASCR